LTDVPDDGTARRSVDFPPTYRRPMAFARNNVIQGFGFAEAIAEIMVRECPAVVQLATVADGYLGLWLERWLKLPFVIYAHGNEILGAMKGDWEKPRIALRRANRILANSHYTANLVRQLGVKGKKIEVVHPGCDISEFHPVTPDLELRQKLLGPRQTDRVILTVGNLVARKGHDMVIRALPFVRKTMPNVTYLIAGEGPYRRELERLASEAGVRENVVLSGRITAVNLAAVYALCDVFIMPSRERRDLCDVEGFGLVFLEAGACGKPVVGGRSGGIPDAVVDGVTGFLANPDDPEAIAQSLLTLLQDRELARRMGDEGRQRVIRQFTWQGIARQVQGILESVRMESDASGWRLAAKNTL
jgi:phosphatidylinositol alpha-1,6-mannosyltransferase